MRIPNVPLLMLVLVSGIAQAAPRQWTSANGKYTVQAELVTVKDDTVELRKTDGAIIKVPLETLSEADRRYVASCAPEDGDTATKTPAAAPEAQATCTLELKRLAAPKAAPGMRTGLDSLVRLCQPQTFYMEISGRGRGSNDGADAFRQVVKKEPAKYVAARPFRGVARLGSCVYGFVLDASNPTAPGYDRLYFDLNGNGDLTDDRVIAGALTGTRQSSTTEFPLVDVPLEIDGGKQDYAFYFKVHCSSSTDFAYASASLTAGVYREGRMLLAGKKRRVTLLDSNSNGRFSDNTGTLSMSGVPHISGDTLLFAPELAGPAHGGSSGASLDKCYVGKGICVDGRFYDCQLSSLGDKLTLKPSDAPLGYVTNPNPGYSAVIYNDAGTVVTISGGKPKFALPEGSWRLASYSMDQFALPKPAAGTKAVKGKRPAKPDQRTAASAAPVVGGTTGRGVILDASATAETPVVQVHKDEVVPFSFGPPYKAVIISGNDRSKESVRLSLLLTGAGGERCTSLRLANGSRPTPPAFTIVNAAGKVVEQGKFEFG